MKTFAKPAAIVCIFSATFAMADEGQTVLVKWQAIGLESGKSVNDDIRSADQGIKIDVSNLGSFYDPSPYSNPIVVTVEMDASEKEIRETGILDAPVNFVCGIFNSLLDWVFGNSVAIVIAIKVVVVANLLRD